MSSGAVSQFGFMAGWSEAEEDVMVTLPRENGETTTAERVA